MKKFLTLIGILVLVSCDGDKNTLTDTGEAIHEDYEITKVIEDYSGNIKLDSSRVNTIYLPKGFRLVSGGSYRGGYEVILQPMDSDYVPKETYLIDFWYSSNSVNVKKYVESW